LNGTSACSNPILRLGSVSEIDPRLPEKILFLGDENFTHQTLYLAVAGDNGMIRGSAYLALLF